MNKKLSYYSKKYGLIYVTLTEKIAFVSTNRKQIPPKWVREVKKNLGSLMNFVMNRNQSSEKNNYEQLK